MPITVFSEWFLLKIDSYIAALNELRLRTFNVLTAISISLTRLILQLLKRTIGIVKNWLKESKIEEWLKTILHESYLNLLEGLYIFLYVLHFFRAFLTLVDYFSDRDNKNLVEVSKFLYACFKLFISILMLTFLVVMIAHGFAPLGMIAYAHIKTFFALYTFSKFVINIITLGFSCYQLKRYNNSPDHDWLKAHYKANRKKHFEILLVGGLITLLLTIVSFGLVTTGPWLWVMITAASIFLLIDMAKAIYYYINICYVQEPEVAKMPQQNSFIDFSINDYYYRKCRSGRLNVGDIETNRIYLLKEIIVKLIQIKIKLNECSCSRFSFFSEKEKLIEKIEGLKQFSALLLTDDYQKNEDLLKTISHDLHENYEEVKNEKKILIPMESNKVKNYLKNILNELPYTRDRFRDKTISYSQKFRQSFFRRVGDCEDIEKACQAFSRMQVNSF